MPIMWLTTLLDLLKSRSRRHRPQRRRREVDCPLRLEALEDRTLMSFTSIASYPAGLNPYAIVTADFNNDNRLDIAVVNNGGNSVSVLLGNASHTFDSAGDAATGTGPRSIAVGDFDNDGNLDIATANAGDVSVLLGKGDGTFNSAQNTSIGSTPLSVAVGDFNGDGKLDLAATSFTSQLQTGYYCGYYGCYPFTYYTYTGYANVLIGDGKGGLASPTTTQLNGAFAYASWAGDLNGDGRRSEEHTSELQSLRHLVCRLLLEKKKETTIQKRPTRNIPQKTAQKTNQEQRSIDAQTQKPYTIARALVRHECERAQCVTMTMTSR